MAARLPLLGEGRSIDRLNTRKFGLRNIDLRSSTLIRRKGIGERTCFGLPNPALDTGPIAQRCLDDGGQISPQTLVVEAGRRSLPARSIEPISVRDGIASSADLGFCATGLRRRRLAEQLHHQNAGRYRCSNQQQQQNHQPGIK